METEASLPCSPAIGPYPEADDTILHHPKSFVKRKDPL